MGADLSVFDAFGLGPPDGAAWLASGLPAEAFEDWLVDRVARRPSGEQVRAVYGADRVLTPGGRIAVYTTGAELRGTPAAPEPLASHVYFHTDEGLVDLGRRAGFADPAVDNDGGGQLLTGRRTG